MENRDQPAPHFTSSTSSEIPVRVSEYSGSNVKGGDTASEADEVSMKDILLSLRQWYRYLISKWLVILVAGLIGACIGLAYTWAKKPVFVAATTFVLESGEGGGGMGQYAGLASMVGIDLGGGSSGIFQGDNIIELYKSRSMIEKSLLSEIQYEGKKQLLVERYVDVNQLRQAWSESPALKNFQFNAAPDEKSSRLQDSLISVIVSDINENYLKVEKPDKQLSIIMVEVQARDEFFAKVFNEQIVKNVNDFYVQTKTKKSLDNVAIIQQKTDSVRTVMNGAIYSAATIADATPNLNPTRQVQRVAPQQRSQVTVETNKAILSELVKNLEMSKIAVLKETPLIQIIDRPVFPLEMRKVSKAKGVVLGFILVAFLTGLILTARLFFKKIME